MYGVVYCIENKINKKLYFGQTTQPTHRRWYHHKYRANMPSKRIEGAITKAMRKHGVDNFEFRVVCECHSREELDKVEIALIAEHNTLCPNGYNIRPGGHGGPQSEETKIKISQTLKGRLKSEETKAKMRSSRKGKPFSIEHRAKLRAARKLRPPISDETRARMSAAQTKNYLNRSRRT